MIDVRRAAERGHANHGWLDTFHTFSFSDYYDPDFMGFRDLRVINEDRVAGGGGFPTHGHRDMEIITYILEGELKHQDNMGNGSVIRPGDVQRMSAGRGVLHSEANASAKEPVHLLQIWILPKAKGLDAGYEQKYFEASEKRNRLRLVASQDGAEGSVCVQQDVKLYATVIEPGARVEHEIPNGRHLWVQVARGELELNGEKLRAGDGASISGEKAIALVGREKSEALVFDLS